MKTIHISIGGPTHKIRIGNKVWCFEMHRMLGPMLCTPDGDGLKREPKHVLEAITHWAKQGQRMDANGYCVWEKPTIFG